jgi:MinD-like ATPase involved in chromosome partitioning or flagellar assembly
MDAVIPHLATMGDYLILDLGVGLPAATIRALAYCDIIFVVVEANPHTIVQTQSLIAAMKEIGLPEERFKAILLNRVRMEQTLSPNDVERMLKIELAVVFTPAPELAHQAARSNQTIVEMYPDSFITQQIYRLVNLVAETEKSS